ncbi:hypothetical protein [Bacillus sp. KH172YL63]|uniref:hypothetical protein n=1 Tax=Bacillus sp. KH172YL63 TaxID=2709784 RepID=UPI0013E47076|nr:hypothetical protein [Bacillus sp. KH172YL63]BCB05188.1 hypothetical protein KH172YL63_33210 [Bacillus sp. KH172YL63]
MNRTDLREAQLKLMKATVNERDFKEVREADHRSLFYGLHIEGFNRFRSFTINSRTRRFVTVLPKTLEYLGASRFTELMTGYFSANEFKGQSVEADLSAFYTYLTSSQLDEKLIQYTHYEIEKYKVASTPKSSSVLKMDYSFPYEAEMFQDEFDSTYFLFVQPHYLESTKIYEITSDIYQWLKEIADTNDPSVDYLIYSPKEESRKIEYIENAELIIQMNIPNLLIRKAESYETH